MVEPVHPHDRKFILPDCPDCRDGIGYRIFSSFIRYYHTAPVKRLHGKVLYAISGAAEMLGDSDALTAKRLVEMGLRAPRTAFPQEFLRHVDHVRRRASWDVSPLQKSYNALEQHWEMTCGEPLPKAFYVAPLSGMGERHYDLKEFV